MVAELNIIYASEMGNAIEVAEKAHAFAIQNNINCKIEEMNNVSMQDLQNMKRIAIVVSTAGEGDLPFMGEIFWSNLSKTSLDLKHISYSICALGDSSHEFFCEGGKKVDKRLQELGAKRLLDRCECDGDTEGSKTWYEEAIKVLSI